MIPIDLSGKVALVAGVGDDVGFAWYIAKALGAAGARLVFSSHPRLVNIVENILERDLDAESRSLPFGAGTLKVEKVIACDVSYDTMDDVDTATRNEKRFGKLVDGTLFQDAGAAHAVLAGNARRAGSTLAGAGRRAAIAARRSPPPPPWRTAPAARSRPHA